MMRTSPQRIFCPIAALRGARSFAYLNDMSASLRAVRLALGQNLHSLEAHI